MNLFISLFVCVVSLHVTVLDAMFNEMFRLPPKKGKPTLDPKAGDYISVYIREMYILTGYLKALPPPLNPNAPYDPDKRPQIGLTPDRFLIRMREGTGLHADLKQTITLTKRDTYYRFYPTNRYFIDREGASPLSGELTNVKPDDGGENTVLLSKYFPATKLFKEKTVVQWGDLHYFHATMPVWAYCPKRAEQQSEQQAKQQEEQQRQQQTEPRQRQKQILH